MYPQELTLRFDSFSRIRQIQILCHESKVKAQTGSIVTGGFSRQICSRMEICVGVIVSESEEEEQVDWKTLGSLSFDTNERSGFLARELKSVHVTSEGDIMKLRLFEPHANKHNKYNQVHRSAYFRNKERIQIGVVAINAMGEALVDVPPRLAASSDQSMRETLGSRRSKTGDASIGNSLDSITLKQFQKLQRCHDPSNHRLL